jgi:transposase
VSHANAPLSATGRLRPACCVVNDGWSYRRAAERFQVSPPTAKRWADRYRRLGEVGMQDRSSRPHHCPAQTPTRRQRRIIKLRCMRRWRAGAYRFPSAAGPAEVSGCLCKRFVGSEAQDG